MFETPNLRDFKKGLLLDEDRSQFEEKKLQLSNTKPSSFVERMDKLKDHIESQKPKIDETGLV